MNRPVSQDHPSLQGVPRTVALILAAGEGRRLGGVPKCLVQLGGKTLLQRLLEELQQVEIDEVRLVFGHHAEALTAHVNTLPRHLWPVGVRNEQPGDDPADSLRAGLLSLGSTPDRLVVLLGDQPLIRAAEVQAALDAFEARERGRHVLVPVVGGEPGHPVVLSAHACAVLRGRPRGGLRAWRAEQPEVMALWPTPNPRHVRDLDTPDDLLKLARDTGLAVALPGATAPARAAGSKNLAT